MLLYYELLQKLFPHCPFSLLKQYISGRLSGNCLIFFFLCYYFYTEKTKLLISWTYDDRLRSNELCDENYQ